MLLRDRQVRLQVHRWVDGGIFAISLWLAHAIRFALGLGIHWHHFDLRPDRITPFYPEYFWLFLITIPMTPIILEWQGYYNRVGVSRRKAWLWQLGRGCALCPLALILIEFLLRREAARGVFALFGACSFGLMCLKEAAVHYSYTSSFGQAQFRRRVLLVGAGQDTTRLRKELLDQKEELDIVGEFDLNQTPVQVLVNCLHEQSINMVVLNARHTYFGEVEKAIQACELEGVEARLLADFFRTEISRTALDDFYGRPALVFHTVSDLAWSRLAKQIIDFFGALAALIVFSPIMLAAAILIKFTSKGPILFRQKRAGLNGQPFVMYKFRSMVNDAEQLKQELDALNEMSGPVFKVSNDPRITPIGRFLRKWSLDETPQLFNVLRFEMSLVGPRPLPVDEVRRFDDAAHRRRLSVKPGLTCTWQVSGRNNVRDFVEWVRMDLQYIDNWSLWMDLQILWRTIWVVIRGTGAR